MSTSLCLCMAFPLNGKPLKCFDKKNLSSLYREKYKTLKVHWSYIGVQVIISDKSYENDSVA